MPDIRIVAPLGGIAKSLAYQDQPPFTSYDSTNMWPIDTKTGRLVSTSRPPLYPLPTPGGLSCNLLSRINGVSNNLPYQSIIAAFNSDLYYWNGTGWTAATGAEASNVPTNRPVYATPFLQKSYIATDTDEPILFDYTDGTAISLPDATGYTGTAPLDCRVCATWAGAVWLAGALAEPHLLYASRIGNGLDWDFSVSAGDEGRAYTSDAGDDEGLLPGPVSAFMPQTQDVMVISTLEGLVALRRHPNQGGIFDPISGETYVLGQGAWCKGPGDVLYMLTPRGMEILPPTGSAIQQVSRNKIPDELVGLIYNYENPVVSMAYDTRWNGIHIAVRDVQEQAWWYDVVLGGFHRMTFNGYPYVMAEFPPIITPTTSGVIYGGYGAKSVSRFDVFGTATFNSDMTVGPFPLSENPLKSSVITKIRMVLGRDTPNSTATGLLRVACGVDGQDAVNRLRLKTHQYEVSLTSIKANNGICFPRVAGHACVMEVVLPDGEVAFEEFTVSTEPDGELRFPRTVQESIQGGPITYVDTTVDFDEDVWEGYSEGTPIAPDCTLTDFTHFIDLSLMPAGWWSSVDSLGHDIRATDINNNPIPLDVINFDYSGETGFAAVKLTQTIPPRPVRLWVGALTAALGANSTYGQYNAYDSFWRQFLPNGQTTDRTRSLNNCTNVGLPADPTDAYVTGPMGNFGTDYHTVDSTNNYGVATASVPTVEPLTMVVAVRDPDTTTLACYGVRDANNGLNYTEIVAKRNATVQNTQGTAAAGGTAETVSSDTVANADVWRHHAVVIESPTARHAYLEGGGKQTDTTPVTLTGLDEIVVGKGSRSSVSATPFTGYISLVQLHTTNRTDCWIDYQYDMMDQGTFWNWDAFVEVNDPPTPVVPPIVSCSTGFVPVTETGTWSGYNEATPLPSVAETEMNWTHWIDLSLMTSEWWAAVASDGVDIRATDTNNIFLPFDLIEFDYAGNTGFAVVNLTQFSSGANSIRLWVGNGSAVVVDPCATYGQYSAYDTYYTGFWPDGLGTDRTGFANDVTVYPTTGGQGPPTVGGVAGPVGNTATVLNGYDQYGLTANAFSLEPSTRVAIVDHPADNGDPDFDEDAAFNGPPVLTPRSIFTMNETTMEWRPDTERLVLRKFKVGSYTTPSTPTPGTFRHYAGIADSTGKREVYIAGAEKDPAAPYWSFSTVADLTVLGGYVESANAGQLLSAADEADHLLSRPFYGTISLVSLHTTNRSPEWCQYQALMIDQATYWDTPWAWTADSNTLPQS